MRNDKGYVCTNPIAMNNLLRQCYADTFENVVRSNTCYENQKWSMRIKEEIENINRSMSNKEIETVI